MNPPRKILKLLPLLVLLAAIATPTPASASGANASVLADASDPRGDGTAEGDFLHVSADYYRRGKLRISMSVTDLAAAAASPNALGAFFAKREGGKCRTEVAGTLLAYETDTGDAARVFVEHEGATGLTGPASVKVKDDTVTITTSAAELAGRGYDCAVFLALATGSEEPEQLDRVSVRLR